MNKKQKNILYKIMEKNEIPTKKYTFKQYRNLKEFKYFQIERINPDHIIKVYGTLKNNNKKKDTSKQLIMAGELIMGATTIGLNIQILIIYIDTILLLLSMYIVNCFLFYWFGRFKLWLPIINTWFNNVKTFITKNHRNTTLT